MEDNNKSPKKDDQKEQYEVNHAPTPHVVHVQKSRWRIFLIVLLVLLLAGGAGYLGYLYLQEKDNANNLQQQVDSLKSQNSQTSEVVAESNEEAAPETVSYSAEVGKFTLTIPSQYVIIKNIDGGFEGGPVTDLEIAKNSSSSGVVDNSFQPNKVKSILKQGVALNTNIQNRNQEYGDLAELENVQVNGVEARVFRLSGLFDINRVYFEKGDVFYEFESLAPESQNELSDDMNAIIAGFKFSE